MQVDVYACAHGYTDAKPRLVLLKVLWADQANVSIDDQRKTYFQLE